MLGRKKVWHKELYMIYLNEAEKQAKLIYGAKGQNSGYFWDGCESGVWEDWKSGNIYMQNIVFL